MSPIRVSLSWSHFLVSLALCVPLLSYLVVVSADGLLKHLTSGIPRLVDQKHSDNFESSQQIMNVHLGDWDLLKQIFSWVWDVYTEAEMMSALGALFYSLKFHHLSLTRVTSCTLQMPSSLMLMCFALELNNFKSTSILNNQSKLCILHPIHEPGRSLVFFCQVFISWLLSDSNYLTDEENSLPDSGKDPIISQRMIKIAKSFPKTSNSG